MKKNNMGEIGEIKAADFLKEHKYKIHSVNYHSRFGEIDIIATNSEYIVFVEVKLRKQNSLYSAIEAISFSKQQKIIKTAEIFLSENILDLQPRFDVIAITTNSKNEILDIEHLENVF